MLVASRGGNDGLRVMFVIVWKFRVGDAETTTFFGSCLDEGFEATEGRDSGRCNHTNVHLTINRTVVFVAVINQPPDGQRGGRRLFKGGIILHLLNSTKSELQEGSIRVEIIFVAQLIFIVLKMAMVTKLTQRSWAI